MAESGVSGNPVNKRNLYKKVLKKNHTFLLENLTELGGILDRLYRDDILSDIKYRDLMEAKTTTDAIRLLLDTVVSKSDKTYEAFLAILTEMRMEFVRDELEKAEVALAKEPPEDIEEKVKCMTLEDKPKEDHYDICILFEDQDRELAVTVKEKLEEIDYKSDDPVKVILYDDEDVNVINSKSDRLRKIHSATTMQFYIVPKYEKEDDYVSWQTDSLILQGVRAHKSTVRVLLTEKYLQKKLDITLANLQEIKWYECQNDNFKDKMLQLMKTLKGQRPQV